ncbi:hypothetical protein V8F06_014181 [Rhypophila decipiens]
MPIQSSTLSARQAMDLPAGVDMSQIPAGIPPPGQTPNFIDPPSLSPVYRGIIYSFVPLMILFLIFRLYTRMRILRKLGWDDFSCLCGAGAIIAYCGTLIPNLDHPLGKHLWDVPVSEITDTYLMYSTVMLVLFFLGAMFVKLTLLGLYLRLFQVSRLAFWMIWDGVVVVTVFYLVTTIVLLEACVPRGGKTWLETTFMGSCTPAQNALSKGSGVFGLISDLYILSIPVWLVSRLTMPPGRRVGVMAVFLTGLFACGCSAAGLAMRFTWRQSDGTWSLLYVFGILELTVGNICACMPVLTQPLRSFATHLMSSWDSLKHYSRTIFTRSGHNHHAHTGSDQFSHEYGYKNERSNAEVNKLPQVPKGTLSGLRSFIHKATRSNIADSRRGGEADDQDSTQKTLASLASVDHDYHHQLKNMMS